MCDRDIATNFGAVTREVILVNSCAVIFICCDCYLFFLKKKKRDRIFACGGTVQLTAAVLFKTDFFVELDIGLLFPEGKRRSEQD